MGAKTITAGSLLDHLRCSLEAVAKQQKLTRNHNDHCCGAQHVSGVGDNRARGRSRVSRPPAGTQRGVQ